MSSQLIPSEILQNSNKILFITHLAIGDFTYLQNDFRAFAQAYPHLKIHLWVDEVRRTSDPSKWEGLKRNVLYDWLEASTYFEKIYKETYSPELYKRSIKQAQEEVYPIVVSLATLRAHKYAKLARSISPHGFVAGMKNRVGIFSLHRLLAYKKLNAKLSPVDVSAKAIQHISDTYAAWFLALFNLDISSHSRFPFVNVPIESMEAAENYLVNWGVDRISDKLIFINVYAKTRKRSWPMKRAAELIIAMRKKAEWSDAWFLINVTPDNLISGKEIIDQFELKRVRIFTADKDFFQLPAMLSLCHLIISVETSIMHLANAVHVPVVALMRSKNPEWAPLDKPNTKVITAERRRDWVKKISAQDVISNIS